MVLDLDTAGLARSSIVRLALSRIFRNAVNIGELLATIHTEAKKIVQAKQVAELHNLKEANGLPFLNLTIDLLWEETVTLPKTEP